LLLLAFLLAYGQTSLESVFFFFFFSPLFLKLFFSPFFRPSNPLVLVKTENVFFFFCFFFSIVLFSGFSPSHGRPRFYGVLDERIGLGDP